MSAEENKALYRQLIATMNRRDLPGAELFLAESAVNHTPFPGEPPGRAGFRFRIGMMIDAFPDMVFAVEDQVADDRSVCTRGTLTGTNTGSFMGMPPTGTSVRIGYIDILRVVNGKFTDHWVQVDQLGMLQQLGMMPAPGA